MALPNSWTTISVGDKILYDDHLVDIRINADYLDNNVANRAYNATMHTSQDVTADNNQFSTADNPHNSAADANQYATADNPHNSAADANQFSTADSPQYISALGSQYPGYDGSHLYGVLYGQYYTNNGSNHSNCTTIYNNIDEVVNCGGHNTSVNSTNYPAANSSCKV